MAMTATSTRSTRRAEHSHSQSQSQSQSSHSLSHALSNHHQQHPPHPHHPRDTRHHYPPQQTHQHQHQLLAQSNSSRPLKRLHEATNLIHDLSKPAKKAKFEIEIPSKTQYQARLYSENIDQQRQQHPHQHQHRPTVPTPTPTPDHVTTAGAVPRRAGAATAAHKKPPPDNNSNNNNKHRHDHVPPPPTAPDEQQPPERPAPTSAASLPTHARAHAPTIVNDHNHDRNTLAGLATKHREKVVNGIRHELDRLQPSSADMASGSNNQGRKLRSQEGVRYKSELSAYFPEYDEVIGNVPKEEHVLMLDTPIVVVDASTSSQPSSPFPSVFPVRAYPDHLFTHLNDSQTIDLIWLESQYKGKTLTDPLPDSYYEPIHRKESRNEKITRNAEKGRSQHEKEQVIRLLDGLRGPDWLKTMGVSGITESKKKQFEPARAHFINKCEVVLDKFRKWAAEEKRLKLEKERAAKESRASQASGSAKDEDEDEGEDEGEAEAEGEDPEAGAGDLSDGEPDDEDADAEEREGGGEGMERGGSDPTESDVDASAKQLHEEAMARSRIAAAKSTRRRPVAVPELPPPPPPEFKSFFKKPYQREAALNKTRRRGRSVLAFGHPVPEPEEADFDLPEEYRNEELLRARARRLRRMQRSTRNRE